MEHLGLMLLLVTTDAQILFPGDGSFSSSSVAPPKPAVAKTFGNGDKIPADSRIYFPGDPVAHAPTGTLAQSGVVFQEELNPNFVPGSSSTPSPISSPGLSSISIPSPSLISSADLSPAPSPNPNSAPRPSLSHGVSFIPRPNPSPSSPSGSRFSVFPSHCGVPPYAERVVGGRVSQPGEWPWLAALGTKRGSTFSSSCGGTLITHRHVLSAQHCFNSPSILDTVRLGDYDLRRSDDSPFVQDFSIAQRQSKGYNQRTYANDIVILVLDRDVVFSDYIQPVCLPFSLRNNDFSGENLIVTGWGKTNFATESYSDVPLRAFVPVVDSDRCAKSYQHLRGNIRPVIDERNLCAGDDTKDSCSGDSGGPLQYLSLSDGRYYLVGIVSFGLGCAEVDYPGVYTRVTSFLDWIVDTVQ